ncbi:hypothetical protein TeGR_g6067, partial [Tetraparma gracilis]
LFHPGTCRSLSFLSNLRKRIYKKEITREEEEKIRVTHNPHPGYAGPPHVGRGRRGAKSVSPPPPEKRRRVEGGAGAGGGKENEMWL